MKSNINMLELANRLGLDRSSVSRALSKDKSHLVSKETRQRVREEAKTLGYRVNLTAAALRRGKSQTIGILVPDLSNEMIINVYRIIIGLLNSGTSYEQIVPLISETLNNPVTTSKMIQAFLTRQVDAIVTLAATEEETEILIGAAREVPVVLAVRSLDGASFPSALCDDRLGGALVAAHFASLGHTQVCQVQGPLAAGTFKNRARGFSEGCREHGIFEVPTNLPVEYASLNAGKEVFADILKSKPWPTAIFAHNDAIAVGLIEAIKEQGLEIPKDFSIAGFNNTHISRALSVPLTTVDYPAEDIGKYASELVSKLIEDPHSDVETRLFTPKLIVRNSTGSCQDGD